MRSALSLLAIAAGVHLGGCASSELNLNTLDIASTTDDLMTEQMFHNLSDFVDSDLAYPTQLVIGSGTATTNDSLTANYTDPLSFAVQTTATLAGSAVQTTNMLQRQIGPMGTTTTTTTNTQPTTPSSPQFASQTGRASSSLGVGGTFGRTQFWSYAPVTDAFRAARLMALYRYVVESSVYGSRKAAMDLKDTYPLLNRTINRNENECLQDDKGRDMSASVSRSDFKPNDQVVAAARLKFEDAVKDYSSAKEALDKDPANPDKKKATAAAKQAEEQARDNLADAEKLNYTRCINSTTSGPGGGPTLTQGTQSFVDMKPDPYYESGPACVICTKDRARADLYGINKVLSGGWLHWRALAGASLLRKPDTAQVGDISLGLHGHYEFFVSNSQEQEKKVPGFGVFILAAATQSDTGASSGGAGGTSAKPSSATGVNTLTGTPFFFSQ